MERKIMDEKHQLKGKKSFEVSEERPSTAYYFDVFISFRGRDTRNGFTSHLYKELKAHGINTFIDNEDLEKGENISIEGSKVLVPVFSKNYADSKWSLREITKMVEINKREGGKRPIIPIFYDVDPSDVKHLKSSFGKALERHQRDQGLSEEKINEWRTALTEAGNISGFCLSDTKGNEAELVTRIAQEVSNALSKVPFDI